MKQPGTSRRRLRIATATGMMLLLLAMAEAKAGQVNGPQGNPTAPWTIHIQAVDEALAKKNVSAAERGWHAAHVSALRSLGWDGLVEVGDAALRIGEVANGRTASEAKARGTYWAALFRARQQGSLDGVLRMAEAFAALGDHEVAAQCVRIAEGLATRSRNAQAHDRVRAFRERLAAQGSGVKHLDADPF